MPAEIIIKLRRGTAAQWDAANPVLAAGEVGIETDTNRSKYGDGVTAWSSLSYSVGDSSGFGTIDWDSVLNKPATFPPDPHGHPVSEIIDLTATADELNVLDGITATTIELNYTDGVTSNIQTQLDNKLASTGKAVDSDKLDGLDSTQFLRSDVSLQGFRTDGRHSTFSGDLNTILSNSIYNINAADVTNEPAGLTSWGFIHTMMHTNSALYGTQLCYSMNSGNNEMYMRHLNNGTWGAWFTTSTQLTASRALVSDGSGQVAVSAVTSTELGYLDGVTSNVQTQLNGKVNGFDPSSAYEVRIDGSTTPKYDQAVKIGSTQVDRSNSQSVIIGDGAGRVATSGYSVIIGFQAFGFYQGYSAPNNSSTGLVAIGPLAMAEPYGNLNFAIAIGEDTMKYGSGRDSIAIGAYALQGNNPYRENLAGSIAIGYEAGRGAYATNTTLGQGQIFIGRYAGRVLGASYGNTAVGNEALKSATTGYQNTAVGYYAARNTTTGYRNTSFGYNAGALITTGINNVSIGYNAQPSANNSNGQFTLGDSSITNLRCNDASISTLSDARDKKDVEELPVGLEFINKLRPVKFVWEQRDGNRKNRQDSGFIAQELMAVEDEYNANSWLHLTLRDNDEKYEAAPARLIPILVNAIQELSAEVAALKEQLNG